jgi:hypothetical protein
VLTGLGMAHVKLRITGIDPALFTSWLRWLRDFELTGTVQQPRADTR